MRLVILTAVTFAALVAAGDGVGQAGPPPVDQPAAVADPAAPPEPPTPPEPPAPPPPPVDPLADRKANMRGMFEALSILQRELRQRAPDWSKVDPAAADLTARAQGVKAWFPEGSGPGPGRTSRARAAIWTQSDAFEAAAVDLMTVTAPVKAMADTRDAGGLNAQLTPVWRSCIGCHQTYREKLSGR